MDLNRSTRSPRSVPRRGFLAPFSTVIAVVLLAANPGLVLAWDSLTFSATEEDHLITLTNQARASNGLAPLIADATLTLVARQRAKYIYDNEWPEHTQKDGRTAFTMLQALGYCSKSAGENLGYNNYSDSQTTQWQFDWFMSSSGHRAIILGTTYDHIGVGAYKGSNSGSIYYHVFVMVIADKCSSSPTPKPTPRPTPRPTPKPTSMPDATPVPSESPGPEITPEPSPTPDSLDPAEQHGALAWKFWPANTGVDLGTPPGPAPSPLPSPDATPDDGSSGSGPDTGLAVVDEAPPLNLLDAIVGVIASAYFGP